MVVSLRAVGVAALAFASEALANKYYLNDTYDKSTSFFDKFDFFTDPDPNGGYVKYLNQTEAIANELVGFSGDEAYLRADAFSFPQSEGRLGVRLESKARYRHGLLIARFTYLPRQACGFWPAFWTLGKGSPNGGVVNIYEGWNENEFNRPAIHTGPDGTYGECFLDGYAQTGLTRTYFCDNNVTRLDLEPRQYQGQGCTVEDRDGPWNSSSGGTYAMEWNSDFIKLYSWHAGKEPANIYEKGAKEIDTSTWGSPLVNLDNEYCDIDSHFEPQQLILNIAYCKNPVGMQLWGETCQQTTGEDTCRDFVSRNPSAFMFSYFRIKDIRHFKAKEVASTSTSSINTRTSSSSGSSISSTLTVTATLSISTSTSSSSISTLPSSTGTSRWSISSLPASSSISGASSTLRSLTMANTSTSSTSEALSSYSSSALSNTLSNNTTNTAPFSQKNGTWHSSTIKMARITTATVYTTTVKTITGCLPEVTNCPEGPYVTTITVPLYTTVCDVDTLETSAVMQPDSTDKYQVYGGNGQNGPGKKPQVFGIQTDDTCDPLATATVTVFVERSLTVVPASIVTEASCVGCTSNSTSRVAVSNKTGTAQLYGTIGSFLQNRHVDLQVKRSDGTMQASVGLFALVVAIVAMCV